ncbi:MAG: glycosyltransferase N-terminal domain-containing protein [Bacteroidia bacterium]
MMLLYSLVVRLYGLLIRCSVPFSEKARKWVNGRKNIWQELELKFTNNTQKVAWFHCASLGEFEQGRPVIEKFKTLYPDYFILLSFFSPSGFEIRKNYPGADCIVYLPLDTPYNASRFINITKPKVVFFIKYEFWLHYLNILTKNSIPHFLFSAVFRNNQIFFKPWGKIFRNALKGYNHIFTQDENSALLLKSIEISQCSKAGDTRHDRVSSIAANASEINAAKIFSEGFQILVAGSTWPEDEQKLVPSIVRLLRSGIKLIIAPHEISESKISSLISLCKENGIDENRIVRFSYAENADLKHADVLIVDNIGMLSSLYRYGGVAYIGGGFGKSIHNTLEAAVYGIPVVFGPAYKKFIEAHELLKNQAAFTVNNQEELEKILTRLFSDQQFRNTSGKKAGEYVSSGKGATEQILATADEVISR